MGTIQFEMPGEPRWSRRHRRGVRYAAVALVAAGWLAAAGGAFAATEPQIADRAPAAADCGLWDRVRTLDVPEAAWESAAAGLGLAPRGPWVSADGLAWEHLDGRVVVVADPRNRTSDSCGERADSPL